MVADFVMDTSADSATTVITGGVRLLVNVGSGVELVTLAVFVSEPLAGARTTTVKLVNVPLASVAMVGQVTMPALVVPPPLALTNVPVLGNVSDTMTLVAVEGPAFVTMTVYVKFCAAVTRLVADLVMDTSANGLTVVMTGGVRLFVGVGSGVEFVTAAKLVSDAPNVGAVTTSVKLVEAPLTSVAMDGQVTAPLLLVPPLVALTKVTPLGKVSDAITFVAMDGPAFVTVMV